MQILFDFSEVRHAEIILEKGDSLKDIEKGLATSQKMHMQNLLIKLHNVLDREAEVQITRLGENSSLIDRNALYEGENTSYALESGKDQVDEILKYLNVVINNAENVDGNGVNFAIKPDESLSK